MFATRALLEQIFGIPEIETLTGHEASEAEYAEKVAAALLVANTEVEGYLQGVVSLPLAAVPQPIAVKASQMAHYYLAVNTPTDGAVARYKSAIRFLERVQDGKAGLGLTAEAEPTTRDDQVISSSAAPIFNADGF